MNLTKLDADRRWTVLTICCTSLLLVSLDSTIVNIALPAIRTDLRASLSGLQWVVDAYTVVLAALLMFSGSLGDRLGRRRIFCTGLVLFTVGSLLCSLAPSLGWLIGFRVVQAVGGSMLSPVALSIVVNIFDEPRQRARAIGIWGAVVGLSMALGPVVGGVLVSAGSWQWVFWVNVPLGLVALALTLAFVPTSRAARVRAFDPVGQVLVVVLLAAATFTIIEGPGRGWSSSVIIGSAGLAVAAGIALVTVEGRRVEPLIDPRFFRSVPFAAATVTAVVAFAALGTFLFLNTLYLQNVRDFTPLRAGLLTLPMAAMAGVCAPLSGRLVASRGPRVPLVLAGLATTAGALLLLPLSDDTSRAQLWAAYTMIGVGFGLVNAPITNTATTGMPRAQAGVAAAIASTSRQTGMCLGVAVSGSLVAGASGARFTEASHLAWALMAGCGLIVFVLGLVSTSQRALDSAARTRHLLDLEAAADEQGTLAAT